MKKLIWGTGRFAKNFLLYTKLKQDEVSAYVESNPSEKFFAGRPVISPTDIKNYNYECIIVASQFVDEIKGTVQECGIPIEKLVFISVSKIPVKFVNGEIEYDWLGDSKTGSEEWVFYRSEGIYTNSKSICSFLQERNDCKSFWEEKKVFDSSKEVPVASLKQKEMITRSFIPFLKRSDIMCDFACGSGEWSELLASYVDWIDGFDCSEKMLETARVHARERGLGNISYSLMDAYNMQFKRKYQHFLLMGLMTYVEDFSAMDKMIEAVSYAIEKGGRCVVRDTLNWSEERDAYFLNRSNNDYKGVYHSQRMYEDIFLEHGFVIQETQILAQYENETICTGSCGYIFRKEK